MSVWRAHIYTHTHTLTNTHTSVCIPAAVTLHVSHRLRPFPSWHNATAKSSSGTWTPRDFYLISLIPGITTTSPLVACKQEDKLFVESFFMWNGISLRKKKNQKSLNSFKSQNVRTGSDAALTYCSKSPAEQHRCSAQLLKLITQNGFFFHTRQGSVIHLIKHFRSLGSLHRNEGHCR